MVKGQGQMLPTSNIHHGAYSYKDTLISDEKLARFSADRQTTDAQTHRQTPPKTIPGRSMRAGNKCLESAMGVI